MKQRDKDTESERARERERDRERQSETEREREIEIEREESRERESERESEREREGGRGRAREWEIESGTTMHTHARLRLLYSTTAPLLPVLDHCSSASRPPLLCLPLARQVLRMLVLARSSVPPPPPPPPRLFPANALAGPATEVSLSLGPSTSAPCPPPGRCGRGVFSVCRAMSACPGLVLQG